MSTHLSQIYLWEAKNQSVELENTFNTNNWISVYSTNRYKGKGALVIPSMSVLISGLLKANSASFFLTMDQKSCYILSFFPAMSYNALAPAE